MAIKSLAAAAVLLWTSAASAQVTVVGYAPNGLAAQEIMFGDYSAAEREIRSGDMPKFDPARQINLAVVLAMTGRTSEAEKIFQRVLVQDPVDVVVASGKVTSSRDAAQRGLKFLHTRLSR